MEGDTFLKELLLLLPFFILHVSRSVEDHDRRASLLTPDYPA